MKQCTKLELVINLLCVESLSHVRLLARSRLDLADEVGGITLDNAANQNISERARGTWIYLLQSIVELNVVQTHMVGHEMRVDTFQDMSPRKINIHTGMNVEGEGHLSSSAGLLDELSERCFFVCWAKQGR